MNTRSPADEIHTAKNEWLFAFLLLDAYQKGSLPVSLFTSELSINTLDDAGRPIGDSLVTTHPLTEQNVGPYYHNLVLNATGACAGKTSAALESIYGPNPATVEDSSARAAFTLIRLTRHAWTHHPQRPCWRINKKGRRRWEILEIGLAVDLTDLDGLPVDGRNFGNWTGFYSLVDYCEQLARMTRQ
ncbi:MAG: hypothetical protein AAB303_04855 [Chloroflexota bacterium]